MSQLARSYWLSYIVNNVISCCFFCTAGVICDNYTCLHMIYEMKSMSLMVSLLVSPLKRFKPSSKIFYWPFQGGTSFVDLLCFCFVLCLLCLCARPFICALWSPAGKGLTSWLSFVAPTVSLSLSHWYPGSGVVLDCIDSWSLHPYLLSKIFWIRLIVCRAIRKCE